jgi:DNA invertase Pin-like site-specific DNA recombinase
MRKGYATQTDVRSRGLWPLTYEPGVDFPWGLVTRRSNYNRRRTANGVELFEESTSRQEEALHSYILGNHLGRVVDVYTDIKSAHDPKVRRPEFENALQDLASGRIGGLACWRPDRLCRRTDDLRRVLTALQQSGGRLLCLTPMVIDTADTANQALTTIFLDMLVAFAQMESDGIGERVSLMHRSRARKGLVQSPIGSPFGHADNWRTLVPEQVALLHEAGERAISGETLGAVCRDWTTRNIVSPTGKRWSPDVLRRMLLSARMVGQREYQGERYDLQGVPPIFDAKTHARICAALERRITIPERAVMHLLSTVAQCGNCGRTVLANHSGKRSTLVYQCRPFGDSNACGKVSVVAKAAEERVISEVVAFLNSHERVRALLRQHASGPEMDAIHKRVNELSESLLALGRALNPPPGVPRMPQSVYYAEVTAIEADRKALHRRMAVSREAALLSETLDVEWTPEAWSARPLDWQRTILKLVTTSIVIEPVGKASATPGRNEFRAERVKVTFAA